MRRSKKVPYSITSSASASSVGGTMRPSALAVLRLSGTCSNTEWGTVSFLKVEERHECHGG